MKVTLMKMDQNNSLTLLASTSDDVIFQFRENLLAPPATPLTKVSHEVKSQLNYPDHRKRWQN